MGVVPVLISIGVLAMNHFSIGVVFIPPLVSIGVLGVNEISIGVVFIPLLTSIGILRMNDISIGVVFTPLLASKGILVMDEISVGVVFKNGFIVSHVCQYTRISQGCQPRERGRGGTHRKSCQEKGGWGLKFLEKNLERNLGENWESHEMILE
jgi:hypothetical protein